VTKPFIHDGWISQVHFSPDGRRVLIGGMHSAVVWEVITGQKITFQLPEEMNWEKAAFSPDGRYILTAGFNTARLWDGKTGQLVSAEMKHESRINHAAFSPDGRYVVTASGSQSQEGESRVWEAPSGMPVIPSLKHHFPVRYAVFSPEGKFVLTAGGNQEARANEGETRLWDVVPLKADGTVARSIPSGWNWVDMDKGVGLIWKRRSLFLPS
jgi:WD40 repeat protein